MLKDRREAAENVAAGLFEAEEAIEKATVKIAELARRMSDARSDAKLSTLYGQDAFERVSETYSAIVQCRRGIVSAHEELGTVQRQIGLGAVSFGGTPKPQFDEVSARDGRRLNAVPDKHRVA